MKDERAVIVNIRPAVTCLCPVACGCTVCVETISKVRYDGVLVFKEVYCPQCESVFTIENKT